MSDSFAPLNDAQVVRDTMTDSRRTATLLSKFLEGHRELKAYR